VCAFVLIRHEARYRRRVYELYGKVKFRFVSFTKADKISKVKLIHILRHTKRICLPITGLRCPHFVTSATES
jgi:hypothetical protein